MVISDISIQRPVFATVISLLIVVFGLAGLGKLPIREYPDIDMPEVTVSVNYRGAAPEVIDTQIVQTIEGAISGIEGVDRIESRSRTGSARTSIRFHLDRDIDIAANDVRDAVSRVLAQLPDDIDPPVIAKTDADARPIIWVTLTSSVMSPSELSDYADRQLVDRFAVLSGVADVMIGGERRYAMRVWLDKQRMAAHQVTVLDIEQALRRNNLELPAGRIQSASRDFTVRADSRLSQVEEFERLIIRQDRQHPLRLADVADVAIGVENEDSMMRANSVTAIGLGIIRQSKANTMEVSNLVRAEIEHVSSQLPSDIGLAINHDESLFIRASIREVMFTLTVAVILVIGVIWLFLGSWRSTLVPAITIPVSVIGAFSLLAVLGFSINVLTLLALILAIGLVVDDAIVMLENIQRRLDLGEPPLRAAFLGARQVAFAIIATTLVLIAVFVPISFMDGNIGRLFSEFGFTLAAAVIFSSVVALSLAPMLCSRWLKPHAEEKKLSAFERFMERFRQRYHQQLVKGLGKPWMIGSCSLLVLVLAAWSFTTLPRELAPTEDRGTFTIVANAPQGATLDYTQFHTQKIEELLAPYRESGVVERVLAINGFRSQQHMALMIVRLAPWSERTIKQQDIVRELRQKLEAVPGLRTSVVNPPALGIGGMNQALQVVVGGPDYPSTVQWSEALRLALAEHPLLMSVDTDYEESQPGLTVELQRERASDLGISAEDVGSTLQAMLATLTVTHYMDRGREYDVILEARPEDRSTPNDIQEMYLRTRSNQLVPLASVVSLKEEGASPELRRVDRLPGITLAASPREEFALGNAVQYVQQTATEILPAEAQISFKGMAEEYLSASGAIYFTFLLALVIVFLVLAAQFESWIHPLIIMLSVPFAVAGAIVTLKFGGFTFNVYSQIGLIMLIGLMAKNGILIVEFANQLRAEGMAVREAIIEASSVRLRPILMTGISTIFGAIPLVLATGAGAESRIAIGVIIIGGLTFATLLTLYLIPVLYLWLAPYAPASNAIALKLQQQLEQHP